MPETLFLTINLIDRFLESKEVTRKNLQLVRLLGWFGLPAALDVVTVTRLHCRC